MNRGQFRPGNLAAVTHGLRSTRVRARRRKALSGEIRAEVLGRWPHLEQQGPLLELLLEGLADVRQLRDYVNAQGGPVSVKGHVYEAMHMLRAREHDVVAVADRLLLPLREMARLGPAAGLGSLQKAQVDAAQRRLRASVEVVS